MRPVDQTTFGIGVDGLPGNCYAACLASILDLCIDEVPHFVAIEGPMDPTTGALWFYEARLWLRSEIGVDLFSYDTTNHLTPRDVLDPSDSPLQQYGIGCGDSPRGDWQHAIVIDLDGAIVHDPHPSRAGIAGPLTAFEVLAGENDSWPLRFPLDAAPPLKQVWQSCADTPTPVSHGSEAWSLICACGHRTPACESRDAARAAHLAHVEGRC